MPELSLFRTGTIQVAEPAQKAQLVELTADIASAYVSNNAVAAGELPSLVKAIFGALTSACGPAHATTEAQQPAVPIKKSITAERLICLEDGLGFKSLKRHLSSKYGLSPQDYRAKWGLPKDYPMVAPAYSASRSSLAKRYGLGQGRAKGGQSAEAAPKARQAKA
jgi:predicted transcriptional regulator